LRGQVNYWIGEAKTAQDEGRSSDTSQAWLQAADVLRRLADLEPNQYSSTKLIAKAIKAEANAKSPGKANARQPLSSPPDGDAELSEDHSQTVNRFIFKKPTTTWEEIGGMSVIKEQLKYLIGLQLLKLPKNVSMRMPSRVLFHGPPGTGKTLLAEAIANTLGATFFYVKMAELVSKYVGESSKIIAALYDAARDRAAEGVSVIFIDEFDALCRQRGEGTDSGAERRILSTFLVELDGFGDKKERTNVITLVATNTPWDLEEAIISRMDTRILVDLPDLEARREIFRIQVEGSGLELGPDVSFEKLAAETDGASGRDIERVCKGAFTGMLRDVNANVPDLVSSGTAKDHTLEVRDLQWPDFCGPLRNTGNNDEGRDLRIERYREWDAAMG
jgi:SpoVK/Ycf46/Vps4 family AAA+-type ATPase